LTRRIDELRNVLTRSKPHLFLNRTGATYESTGETAGHFHIKYWGKPVSLSYPDFVAYQEPGRKELSSFDLALLLYYFNVADGTPLSDRWISFSELPDGKFYNQAFQSYTGQRLVQAFGNDRQAFEHAAARLEGQRMLHGDVGYMFPALPHVPLMAAYWQGDEDFPSNFQILFDASASHYLPTDAYAILGSTLTRRLISSMQIPAKGEK
jgi:hypothetical protein